MANIAILGPKDDGTIRVRCTLRLADFVLELSNAQDMLHLGHHFEGRQRYV